MTHLREWHVREPTPVGMSGPLCDLSIQAPRLRGVEADWCPLIPSRARSGRRVRVPDGPPHAVAARASSGATAV
jgi:hypothetical protein